jgi:hypothetical protein
VETRDNQWLSAKVVNDGIRIEERQRMGSRTASAP